QNGYSIRR
ncbi:putative exonuclease, partial [Escherichia coli 96.0109]